MKAKKGLLFEARRKKGMTQTEIAERAGISQAAYCNIEGGKRNPSVGTARRIGKVLGIEWFLIFEKE